MTMTTTTTTNGLLLTIISDHGMPSVCVDAVAQCSSLFTHSALSRLRYVSLCSLIIAIIIARHSQFAHNNNTYNNNNWK